MKHSMLMPLMVLILCGGAWATQEPERMANESLVEATAVTNFTEILKTPFLKDDDTMDTVTSLSYKQKMREALAAVHCAFMYMAAKLKREIDRFEKNMEVLHDLHRRRQEALHMAMRAKRRRVRKMKAAPPLHLSRQIRPLPVRLMAETTVPFYFAANINDTAGPKHIIMAAI